MRFKVPGPGSLPLITPRSGPTLDELQLPPTRNAQDLGTDTSRLSSQSKRTVHVGPYRRLKVHEQEDTSGGLPLSTLKEELIDKIMVEKFKWSEWLSPSHF